jgi:hypothetical protein
MLVNVGSKKHPKQIFVNQDPNVVKSPYEGKRKEHVFYSSQAKHEPSTNIYEFEYPGDWRTSNNDLEFGVRGIYLKLAPRTVSWKLTISALNKEYDFLFTFSPTTTLYEFVDFLNSVITGWIYVAHYNVIELNQTGCTISDKYGFEAIGSIWTDDKGAYISMWDRGECLVTASFTHQTENGHLGYTNSQYSPMKVYHIHNPCPTSFIIELFTASSLMPVELALDGMDYLCLECVVKS